MNKIAAMVLWEVLAHHNRKITLLAKTKEILKFNPNMRYPQVHNLDK